MTDHNAWTVVLCAGILLVAGAALAAMLLLTRRGAPKRGRGRSGRAAPTTCPGGSPLPRPVPLAAELAWVPVVLATLALAFVLYPQMPDQIPMRMDFSGTITRYAEKSPLSAAFPVLMQVFVGLCIVVSHLAIIHPRRHVAPEAPFATAYACALYVRAWSRYTFGLGMLLAAAFALWPLANAGVVGLGAFGLVILAVVFAALVAAVVLVVRYGWDGVRAAKTS